MKRSQDSSSVKPVLSFENKQKHFLFQVSVERFSSTTHPCGGRSCRVLRWCLNTVVTRFHHSATTTTLSSSPPTSGILSGRGRCSLRPRTAPSTCGTGSTCQLLVVQHQEQRDEKSSCQQTSGVHWIYRWTDKMSKSNLRGIKWRLSFYDDKMKLEYSAPKTHNVNQIILIYNQ